MPHGAHGLLSMALPGMQSNEIESPTRNFHLVAHGVAFIYQDEHTTLHSF